MKNKIFNSKVFFIVFSVLVLAAVSFFYGFKLYEGKYDKFIDDGYIIGKSENYESSNIYYFLSGNKYKENYDKTYSITNSDKEDVKVDPTSFIHYNNGNIGVLSKNVILDLTNISSDSIKYYNFYKDLYMEKSSDKYVIKNSSKSLVFNSFLLKSDENKFLIVSPTITLTLNEETREFKNFVELTFLDGDIVRLENNESVYQTIATGALLNVLDVKIDLNNRNVIKNEETIINLNELTINSDDNIDIPVDATTTTTKEISTIKITTKSNSNGSNSNGSIFNPGEEINGRDNVETLIEPTFNVYNLNVTTYSVDFYLNIVDSSNILTGAIDVKIVNSGTGKIVYENEITSYFYDTFIETNELDSNTEYTVVVSATVDKNGISYTKNFVQKTFKTEDLGISLIKDYFTTDSLNFLVQVEDYSNIKSFEAYVYDSANNLISDNVYEIADLQNLSFINLKSNEKYKIVIKNFQYNNLTVLNDDQLVLEYKTLKNEPSSTVSDTFGSAMYTADKRTDKYTFSYTGINDPDNGVVEYRYEIYQGDKLYKSMSSKELGSVTMDLGLQENDPENYTFRVITVFYDNEKTIEYFSELVAIKINDIKIPEVHFEEDPNGITFNSISGSVVIDNTDNLIDLTEEITIIYFDAAGNRVKIPKKYSVTDSQGNNIYLPLTLTNLSNNQTYSLMVYATLRYKGNNYVNTLLTTLHVKTLDTEEFKVEWYTGSTKCEHKLDFSFSLNYNSEHEESAKAQLDTIQQVDLNIKSSNGGLVYRFSLDAAQIAILKGLNPDERAVNLNEGNTRSIKEILDRDAGKSANFIVTIERITATNGVVLKLKDASKDVYPCQNYIPSFSQAKINVKEIKEEVIVLDENNENSKELAVVGYKVSVPFSNNNDLITKAWFDVVDAKTFKTIRIPATVKQTVGEVQFRFESYEQDELNNWFKRGGSYYFGFGMEVNVNFEEGGQSYKYSCQYPRYQKELLKGYAEGTEFKNSMVTKNGLDRLVSSGICSTNSSTSNANSYSDFKFNYMVNYYDLNSKINFVDDEVEKPYDSDDLIVSEKTISNRLVPRFYIYPSRTIQNGNLSYVFKYKIYDEDYAFSSLVLNNDTTVLDMSNVTICTSKNCNAQELEISDVTRLNKMSFVLNYKENEDAAEKSINSFNQKFTYNDFNNDYGLNSIYSYKYQYVDESGNKKSLGAVNIELNVNKITDETVKRAFLDSYVSTEVIFKYTGSNGQEKNISYDISTNSSPYNFTCVENICNVTISLQSLINGSLDNDTIDIFDKDIQVVFKTNYDSGIFTYDDIDANNYYSLEYGYSAADFSDSPDIVRQRYLCGDSPCAGEDTNIPFIASGSKYKINVLEEGANRNPDEKYDNNSFGFKRLNYDAVLYDYHDNLLLYASSIGYNYKDKKILIKKINSIEYTDDETFHFNNDDIVRTFTFNQNTKVNPLSVSFGINYDFNEYTSGTSGSKQLNYNYLKASFIKDEQEIVKYISLKDSISDLTILDRTESNGVVRANLTILLSKLFNSIDYLDNKNVTFSAYYCDTDYGEVVDNLPKENCNKFSLVSTDANHPIKENETEKFVEISYSDLNNKYVLDEKVAKNEGNNYLKFNTDLTDEENYYKFFDLHYAFNYGSYYEDLEGSLNTLFDGVDYKLSKMDNLGYYKNVDSPLTWSDLNIDSNFDNLYEQKIIFKENEITNGQYKVCISPYVTINNEKMNLVDNGSDSNCLEYNFTTLIEPSPQVYATKDNENGSLTIHSMIEDKNLTVKNNIYSMYLSDNKNLSQTYITNKLHSYTFKIDLNKQQTVKLEYSYSTNNDYSESSLINKTYEYIVNPSINGIYIGTINFNVANKTMNFVFKNSTKVEDINSVKYSFTCVPLKGDPTSYYAEISSDSGNLNWTKDTESNNSVLQITDSNVLGCQTITLSANFYYSSHLIDKYSTTYNRS